jgi:hypothetical protein
MSSLLVTARRYFYKQALSQFSLHLLPEHFSYQRLFVVTSTPAIFAISEALPFIYATFIL